MRTTYILKCADCPFYVHETPAVECGWTGSASIPQDCTHPANDGITLGGPEVLPHHCPLIKEPMAFRAVLARKPK